MEAFNLFKFWRGNGHDSNAGVDAVSDYNNDGRNPALETDEESDEESFFDLVLNGADYCCRDEKPKTAVDVMSKGEGGFSFPESPKDVFLKGNAFSVDSCSKPQSPISLLRTAPKFRVFFLGFKKSKMEKSENDGSNLSPKHQLQKTAQNEQSKRFSVNCKVEDVEVVGSLPARDYSLRSKLQIEKFDDFSLDEPAKRFAKNAVPKYLKLIKPLYSKASKCTEKSNFSDKVSVTSPLSPATAESMPTAARRLSEERQGTRTAGFSAVRKHLVKSRSASAGTASPPARRRDDSLLQEQHDGIQGAILHCKTSYNSMARGSSLLSRSVSEPYHQKSTHPQRSSYEETKRCSI